MSHAFAVLCEVVVGIAALVLIVGLILNWLGRNGQLP